MAQDFFSLQKTHKYLRSLVNSKLVKNLSSIIDQQVLSSLKSKQSRDDYTADELSLQKLDKYTAAGAKRVISQEKDAAQLQAALLNLPQLFRIHRDILYTNMSRKDRILAGVKEQVRKAYCNKEYNEVYV